MVAVEAADWAPSWNIMTYSGETTATVVEKPFFDPRKQLAATGATKPSKRPPKGTVTCRILPSSCIGSAPSLVLQTGRYSNAHTVQYNRAYDVQVDAAPDWGGDPEHTNPEQALARRCRVAT